MTGAVERAKGKTKAATKRIKGIPNKEGADELEHIREWLSLLLSTSQKFQKMFQG